MKNIKTNTLKLVGNSYEIGTKLGKFWKNKLKSPDVLDFDNNFKQSDYHEAIELFNKWCSGISQEIEGFANELKIPNEKIPFYFMTYLLPRCSQIAIPKNLSHTGKIIVARNYEFSHEFEDFVLIKTQVKDKYTHIGTSVANFGREEGLNEKGLSVTMSSCGFPVGALPYMRNPKIKGLQFWIVIRGLLEACRDVDEALDMLSDMPIAYNLNLILADKKGNIALFETLDGKKEYKRLDIDSKDFIHATNHPHLEGLKKIEPIGMIHSKVRYDYINDYLVKKELVQEEDLKHMLLSKYPNGLSCNYYEDFLGTTKSIIISPEDGDFKICWGGREENGWDKYNISEELPNGEKEIFINLEKTSKEIFETTNI